MEENKDYLEYDRLLNEKKKILEQMEIENLPRENQFLKEQLNQLMHIKVDERKRRNLLLQVAIFGLSGIVFLIFRHFLTNGETDDIPIREYLLVFSVLFISISVITFLYTYLEFNIKVFNFSNESTENNEEPKFVYGRSDSDTILDFELSNSKKRVINEIQRLTKSASLNLAVGSGITGIVVIFLGYQVFNAPVKFDGNLSFLSHFLPRLSLIVFAEIFAFFFLKVYKSTLNDIKYFHNELTNCELKFIATRIALTSKNEEFLKSAIEQFLMTERNFVLKKDESTIDIQKEKIQSASNKSVIDALRDVIKLGK